MILSPIEKIFCIVYLGVLLIISFGLWIAAFRIPVYSGIPFLILIDGCLLAGIMEVFRS